MKHEMKGFGHVFGFSFAQLWKNKRHLCVTVVVAVLCFLLPAVILPLAETLTGGAERESTPDSFRSSLEQVYVVDRTALPEAELSFLNGLAGEGENFSALTYRAFGADAQGALEAAAGDNGRSLILCLDEDADGTCTVRVLLPENSRLTETDVSEYRAFIQRAFPKIWGAKLGLDAVQIAKWSAAVEIEAHNGAVAPEEGSEVRPDIEAVTPQEQTRKILAMILPYFNIMILYFMVLFYGQSVANSVILEKTSKLVDTFLVAIRPGAMVMGKLLAIAISGALQLFLWLAALLGGFAVGGMLVRVISPDTTMGIVLLMDGIFSLSEILLSLLILFGGFLLYCALAAIGGAMASKPEELSSTNALFSMVLVISFFCTLYAGGIGEGMSSSAAWLNWVPFTAILVAPSRILTGELTLGGACVTLALVFFAAFVLVMLAGKIYRMLILYKGKVPKLHDVVKMLGNRS